VGKRFTDTEKWGKKWFRNLSPKDKLAWNYLCDKCDCAGVISLDEELADFQIKEQIDWNRFLEISEGRVERLPNGRLWLTTFLEFQYPNGLSEDCTAHNAIFVSLRKNTLLQRVLPDSAESARTHKDKDKDKETETDKDSSLRKGDARGKPGVTAESVPVPEGFETPEVRKAIGDWLAYKAKRGKPYKDAAFLGRKVAEFAAAGAASFVAAVNSSIGNNYDGIYPAKEHNGKQPTKPGAGQRYQGD
jgi:hypothetical protein